ncbi:MAG: phosphatidate cytidylyltransferase [Acidobacteria bacterium]|nr:phosphatidate cytidylyltransferase [Acidobacteriota bacterium]
MMQSLWQSADPILRAYTLGAVILLVSAALLIWAVALLTKKDLSGVWRTYRGWLIMVPIAFAALWLGRTATIVGLALIAIVGFKEFARATGVYKDWVVTGTVYLGITALAILTAIKDPRTGDLGWYGLFMATPVYVIAALLAIPVFRDAYKGQLQRVSLAIVGFVYFGWMFLHLGFLTNSHHMYGYLLFLLVAVELNDVSAFIFGKTVGGPKLRPHVSPNKTWGGSLGALCVSLTLPWLLHASFPHFNWHELVLTGLIVGIGGQLGDLTISFIKRDLGIKDMGAVIPGHGGILDRVDSLIYVAPLFFHMVRWFQGIH